MPLQMPQFGSASRIPQARSAIIAGGHHKPTIRAEGCAANPVTMPLQLPQFDSAGRIPHARETFGLSERRACSLIGVARRVVRYEPTRPDDAGLRVRLRELAGERRRFGYRRLGYLLAREGLVPNHKKLLRIYREEGLKVRRRGGRKRALGIRAPMTMPQGPNQRWSLDFVSDAFACGRRFRILCVVDDFTRECLALVGDTSLSGARVARELDGDVHP